MTQRSYRYVIEGTITVDETDVRSAYLGGMSKFVPEHDDPERQADQFAEMAATPLDFILVQALQSAGAATQAAICSLLPDGSDCPPPQVSIPHGP